MYTLEEVTLLIPYKFRIFDWASSGTTTWRGKQRGKVNEQVLTTISHTATRSAPCLYCGMSTRGQLRKVIHPILQPVVEMNSPWPAFCSVECVRKYIVENQIEILLYLTA